MYAEQQLRDLIDLARAHGKTVEVTFDEETLKKTGSVIIDTVRIVGIAGVGHHAISGYAAFELLLQAKADGLLGPVIRACWSDVRMGRVYARLSTDEKVALIDVAELDSFADLGLEQLVGKTTREAVEQLARHKARQTPGSAPSMESRPHG